MKNYKINIDKPKPTQEEILAGRNFDSVLAQYKAAPGQVIKKPFWQSAGFIGSVAAVAATVAIVAMVVSNNGNGNDDSNNPGMVDNNNTQDHNTIVGPADSNDVSKDWTPTKRTIAPPLAALNVPYQQYKVSAKAGGTISYPTGTKLKFQANSFVDRNGVPVTGNVEVKYREMHDAVDFFLAGVPMEYDSAGQTYVFESAGMMEVAAFVNGQVVYLDPNKPMQVEMASKETGTQYNLYYFDTVAGNWQYRGKDKVSEMPVSKDERAKDSLKALDQWTLAMYRNYPGCGGVVGDASPKTDGSRPRKADPTKNRFVVDFNKQEFPEMANYENVLFEVDESKEKFDPRNYDIVWEKVSLSRGDAASTYKLSLEKGLKKVKLDVYPVLDGAEYDKALAEYDKKHKEYLEDSMRVAQAKMVTSPDGKLNPDNPLSPFVFDPATASAEKIAYAVQRSFEIAAFGTYNCDVPRPLPVGAVLDLALNGPDGLPFAGLSYSHVDRQTNSVMSYSAGNRFYCNPGSQNMIWAAHQGDLYYAENESFVNLPATGKSTITLKKVMQKFRTADEIRAFFHLGTNSAQ